MSTLLAAITLVIGLGIAGQWLARRLRIPAVLLLLGAGGLAGPVLGLLPPSAVQADWTYALAALAAGLLLFESGLHLRLSDLRDEPGREVRALLVVGSIVTAGLAGAGAYVLLDLNMSLAVLIGLLVVITGGAVTEPLLRHVNLVHPLDLIARREGRMLEPLGAILAVIALEVVLQLNRPATMAGGMAAQVAQGVFMNVFVSVGVGMSAMGLLVVVLRRRLAAKALRPALALGIVVAAYVGAEALQGGAGLLTTAVLGVALANQPYTDVPRPLALETNLRTLLVGVLVVLLAAQLEPAALQQVDGRTLLFVGALVVVVRPVAVLLSGLFGQLTVRMQGVLAWLAPRGVLLVALAPLFALRLGEAFPEEAAVLVPLLFSVVIGTGAFYGLTSRPVARWLGFARTAAPPDILFVGAARWVRRLARVLEEVGADVMLVDANPQRVRRARRAGLTAIEADADSPALIDALQVTGLNRVLILLPNDVVASRVARRFEDLVAPDDIYQLTAHPRGSSDDTRRGHPLFGDEMTYAQIERRLDQGHVFALFELYHVGTDLNSFHRDGVIPLFIRRDGQLVVVGDNDAFRPQPSDELIALIDEERVESAPPRSNAAVLEVDDDDEAGDSASTDEDDEKAPSPAETTD